MKYHDETDNAYLNVNILTHVIKCNNYVDETNIYIRPLGKLLFW